MVLNFIYFINLFIYIFETKLSQHFFFFFKSKLSLIFYVSILFYVLNIQVRLSTDKSVLGTNVVYVDASLLKMVNDLVEKYKQSSSETDIKWPVYQSDSSPCTFVTNLNQDYRTHQHSSK